MNAKEHAIYCKDIAIDLRSQLDVDPVFSYAINEEGVRIYVYCHPKDAEYLYIKDYEYPHREL